MKLYYKAGACSLAIRIAINEMNVPCEFESVDLATKKTETGVDFLTISAKGSVPALQLDNGQVLTEGSVIQQYLADTHEAYQLLPAVGEINRYRVLEWLNFVGSDLHKGCSPLFNGNIPDDVKENVFKPNLKKAVSFVEKHLNQHKFLTGETVCIADFYLFTVLRWLSHFKMPLSEWPSVEQFFDRLHERKSVQKSLKEEGLLENAAVGACSVK